MMKDDLIEGELERIEGKLKEISKSLETIRLVMN